MTAKSVALKQESPGRCGRFTWLLTTVLIMAQAMVAQARESFADLADKVSPAVVNITTSTVVAQGAGPSPIVPEGSPFEDFFREFQDRSGPGRPAAPHLGAWLGLCDQRRWLCGDQQPRHRIRR